MQTFRTEISVPFSSLTLNHTDKILLMGSCFTEQIGQRLSDCKFQILLNPNGIVYNPVSLAESLDGLWSGKRSPDDSQLFEHQGLWHSWAYHSRFSAPTQKETLDSMKRAYNEATEFVQKSDCLIVTFGTADLSVLKSEGRVVANNHKMPASLFEQRRLNVEEMVGLWMPILENWSGKKVLLTVSPVRHLRQGLIENQRSKAVLLLACEAICQQLPFVHYFPAYELLMDDLRDYRFYDKDMVHPSTLAVDYIWKQFSEAYFSESTQQLNERIMKIKSAMHHRPFHPHTTEHQAFLLAQLERIQLVKQEFPDIDWSIEQAYFSQNILRNATTD